MIAFINRFLAAWRRRRISRKMREGMILAQYMISVVGIESVQQTWMGARSGKNDDWFDKGFELALGQAIAMAEGGELVVSLEGGDKPGLVVGKCNSYGEWTVKEDGF